jgi:plasmid replication initiation protein
LKSKEKIYEKNLVVKSNKVVEARYKLTVQEQRIILALTSMIKPEDKDFHTYRFTINQLMELTGVKGKAYYSQIKEITKGLIEKSLTIKEPTGDLQIGWLSSAKYWDKEGSVDLCFSPKLKPYLLQLKSHFTQYQLENVAKLRSNYSIRIYELLKQYEGTNQQERIFNLDELRAILGIEDNKHKRFGDFKRHVLEVAKKGTSKENRHWF